MKRKLFILILTFQVSTSCAQFLIKGRVLDDVDKPIPNATVKLQHTLNSLTISTSGTDSSGSFVAQPPQDETTQLLIAAPGFQSSIINLPFCFSGDTLLLIRLAKTGQDLKQVNIYAKAPLIERKTDRVIFNVENSLAVIGADGLEALGKAPGLRLNDNGIGIVGKNAVRVMINDRLLHLSGTDLINYLRSIPASNIKRIEIITNPSAKYEAEGNSGLINIVLQKNQMLGLNGMINTGVILASRYTTGFTGNFNFNTEKLHVSSNLTLVKTEFEVNSSAAFNTASSLFQRDINSFDTYKGLRGELRADYDFSANTVAGIRYMGGIISSRAEQEGLAIYSAGRGAALDSSLVTDGLDKDGYRMKNLELYVQHRLDTNGKKIEFASNFFGYGTDAERLFGSNTFNSAQQQGKVYSPVNYNRDDAVNILTNKLDITLPYTFATFELGAKLSHIEQQSELYYNPLLNEQFDRDNKFDYTENTQSLYGSAEKVLGKWSVKLGLRVESSQTRGLSSVVVTDTRNNYTQLFPTVFLKHELNKSHVLSFSYGRRINRPDYSLLNPARLYSGLNIYEEGNPYLKPSYSNNFELNYNYKDWLNTSVYANFLSNGFSSLALFDAATNIQALVNRNFSNSTAIGLSETFTINQFRFWESNNQLNIYMDRSASTGAISEGTLRRLSAYFSTDHTFTLNKNKTLMANTTFWYQFPEVSDRLIAEAYCATDLSFRAMLLQRKLTLALNISDVFKTSIKNYQGTINGVEQYSNKYRDNRKTRIAIIYRFGNGKANKAARNNDAEESQRVKQGA